MLGVVHEGVAFPVAWSMLDKRGNSDSQERMNLVNEFLERFGRASNCLFDRRPGVSGQRLVGILLSAPLTPFRIRIRENHNLRQGNGFSEVSVVFQDLKQESTRCCAINATCGGSGFGYCCFAA